MDGFVSAVIPAARWPALPSPRPRGKVGCCTAVRWVRHLQFYTSGELKSRKLNHRKA